MSAGVLRRLLVATNGFASDDNVIAFAVALAKRHASSLTFCYAVDRAGAIAECSDGSADLLMPLVQDLDAAAAEILASAVAVATKAAVPATSVELDGRPVHAVVAYATANRIDAIVMGTSGNGGAELFFLGSIADGVLRLSDIPVFVISPHVRDATGAFERIFVAVDDSDPSRAAASFAASVARSEGSRLVVCSVMNTHETLVQAARFDLDPEPMIDAMRAETDATIRAEMQRAGTSGIRVDRLVVDGEPAGALLETARAQQADLIVIGTHGRRGLRRLFVGSVAEGVARQSPVPVVVVRTLASIERPGLNHQNVEVLR